jgi:hypothetical protein
MDSVSRLILSSVPIVAAATAAAQSAATAFDELGFGSNDGIDQVVRLLGLWSRVDARARRS